MKKFAIILSGCGVYDGSEIHEAVMAMLAIAETGNRYQIFAPDIPQYHVVDHLKGKPTEEVRNVLTEAARIARGKINPLSELKAESFDGIVLPGGFGAAKNLSNYAFAGNEMTVLPELEALLLKVRKLKKPIGAMCIAPVILAKVLGSVDLTIGNDAATASHIESFGARHINTGNGQIVADRTNKVVSTPCYMLEANLVDIANDAREMIKAMIDMM